MTRPAVRPAPCRPGPARRHRARMRRTMFSLAACAVLAAAASAAGATTFTWDGDGPADTWSAMTLNGRSNWTGTGPLSLPNGAAAHQFIFTGPLRTTSENDIAGLRSAGLTFAHAAGPFVLRGLGLTSEGDIVNASPLRQRIELPLTVRGTQLWDGGSGGLAVTGRLNLDSGTLTLRNVELAQPAWETAVRQGAALRAEAGSRIDSGGGFIDGGSLFVGTGSSWRNQTTFTVGTGQATFADGARLDTRDLSVAAGPAAALLTLRGAGTTGVVANRTYVNWAGGLAVENGARFETVGLTMGLGEVTASRPGVRVQGAGATLAVADLLTVGSSGAWADEQISELRVLGGASVQANKVIVGMSERDRFDEYGNGRVRVSGAGSTWTSGRTEVGWMGLGEFVVEAGAQATTVGINMAMDAGSRGQLTVTGPGSKLETGLVFAAQAGEASITVSDGALLRSRGMTLGGRAATLRIEGGATVDTQPAPVLLSGAATRVDVLGGGTLRGQAIALGDGTLHVDSGRVDSVVDVTLTRANTSVRGDSLVTGTWITVDGGTLSLADQAVLSSWETRLGGAKPTVVTMAGGRMQSTEALIGGAAATTVTLSGGELRSSAWLTIGGAGATTLTLDDALLSVGALTVGGSGGSVVQFGSGSRLTMTGTLRVGYDGPGTVNLRAAERTLGTQLQVGPQGRVEMGGTLAWNQRVQLDGGQLEGPRLEGSLRGHGSFVGALRTRSDQSVLAEGGTLVAGNPNGTSQVWVAGNVRVAPGATLELRDLQRARLDGAVTLDDGATLRARTSGYGGAGWGELQFGSATVARVTGQTVLDAQLLGEGRITLHGADARLKVVGDLMGRTDFGGDGEVVLEGVLSPGGAGAVATLDFGAGDVDLRLGTGARVALDLTAPGSADRLVGIGTLSAGGTLALSFSDGTAWDAGAVFDLFDFATFAGRFAAVEIGGLDAARVDLGRLSLDGTVTVSPVPEPGTWALWLAGLATVGGLARRRGLAR